MKNVQQSTHQFSSCEYGINAGPIPRTVVDFWRLMWQERPPIIVMLTNLKEGNKVKCQPYWPESGKKQFGPFTVAITDQQIFADYTMRTLKVTVRILLQVLHVTFYPRVYRIAGNFRGVKSSLFSWAGWPPRNFNIGVAYRNVGMPCSHETKRTFYSRKPPFLELNEFFTPRNLSVIR